MSFQVQHSLSVLIKSYFPMIKLAFVLPLLLLWKAQRFYKHWDLWVTSLPGKKCTVLAGSGLHLPRLYQGRSDTNHTQGPKISGAQSPPLDLDLWKMSVSTVYRALLKIWPQVQTKFLWKNGLKVPSNAHYHTDWYPNPDIWQRNDQEAIQSLQKHDWGKGR